MKFLPPPKKNNKMNKNYLSVLSRNSTCIKYDPLPEKKDNGKSIGSMKEIWFLSSLKCQIFLLFLFWTCTLYFKGENKCTKPDPSVHNIPPSHWPPKDTPILPISSSANEVHIVLIIRMEKRTAPFCNSISFKVNYKMTSFKISNLLTFSVYFWNIHVAQTVKL